MTRHEFELALEGRKRKYKRQRRLLAEHAAWIINHRTPALGEKRRKAITPQQLLGEDEDIPEERRLAASSAKWKAFVRAFQSSGARDA